MKFAFSRDELNQAVLDANYSLTVEHLVNRLKSNRRLIEYCKQQCEQRFNKISRKKERSDEYRRKLAEREDFKRDIAQANKNIEEYQRKMSSKVRNFQEKVNSRLGMELAQAMQQKRP